MSDLFSKIKNEKLNKEIINEEFKSRKQQIDNELNRIKQILLKENTKEISLIIYLKFSRNEKPGNGLWRSLACLDPDKKWEKKYTRSELTITDEVKTTKNM